MTNSALRPIFGAMRAESEAKGAGAGPAAGTAGRLVVAVLSPKTGVERAVQRGVALAAGKFGWALEVIDPALTGDDVRPFAELLGRADGVIVRLAERCGLVRPFLGPDVPMVGIDIAASRDSGLWATLLPDNAAIGAVAAEELLATGLACHAIVPSLPALTWGVARDRGFAARVRASGGDVRVYRPHEGWRAAAEHGALARWLAALPRPFGLFGCNDVVARFALSACKSAGLAVPDEARVVGADNDPEKIELDDDQVYKLIKKVRKQGQKIGNLQGWLRAAIRNADILPKTSEEPEGYAPTYDIEEYERTNIFDEE